MSRKVGVIFVLSLLVILFVSFLGKMNAQRQQHLEWVVAWTGAYSLEYEWVKIWINQNGTIDLSYNITIKLDSGDSINYVVVGQPNGYFTIGEAADQYGNSLVAYDVSSGSDYRVRVNLATPLTAGHSIWFTLITNVAHIIYEDIQNPGNVGMQFVPCWWPTTINDLRVLIVLPPNVTVDEVKTSVDWNNMVYEDSRLAIYWEKQNLLPNEKFPVGVSFPKEYVQTYETIRRVHNLDTGSNYATIQEAIDSSETLDGHTIFVEKGTYYENVVIDKSLWLIGENNSETIIDGKGMDNVLTINADNVNITGFSVQNSGSTWPNNFGVDLSSRRNCTIENCIIKNHGYSAYLQYAHNNTVRNNIITNSSSYSVFIYGGDNNTVVNNTITDNKNTGVEIERGSEGNIIANNNISSNLYEGVYVLHSDSNFIVNNLLSFNGHGNPPLVYPGIRLMYSSNNTLAKNIILNNTGGIIIYFDWSSIPARYNIIKDNVIENNDYGIILHYGGNESHPSTTTYNQVNENTLKNNGYGLYLIGADNNTFYHNNLLASTIAQVVVENSTNIWDNGLEGNYWSNYTGADLDHDGIGDSYHVINTNNVDHHPLMGMFHSFNASWTVL